jgi:DHA2 family multidrug resistance protein-like MFS transporter
VMTSVPPEKAGAASGLSETSFEFGAALGIALLGSLITVLYSGSMEAASVSGAARDTLAGAVAVAKDLPATEAQRLLVTARSAYVDAFTVTSALSAVIAVAGAAFTLAFLSPRRPGAELRSST